MKEIWRNMKEIWSNMKEYEENMEKYTGNKKDSSYTWAVGLPKIPKSSP